MRGLFMFERGRISRAAQRKRYRIFMYSVLAAVMAFSLLILLAYVAHNDTFLVRSVSVQGNALVSERDIKADVDPILNGSYIGLFPKRNYLLVPMHKIVAAIQNAHPAIDSVVIERDSFVSMRITVREREPFVLWCLRYAYDGENGPQCSFADRYGFIFSPAPDFSSDVYLRFTGKSSTSTQVGGRIFPPERFREFSFFLQSLRDLGIVVRAVSIEDGAAGIPDYFLELVSGARLLVSGKLNLEQTLADITAFFTDPEIATSSKRFLDTVDYIDFRFENKVYYRMRE